MKSSSPENDQANGGPEQSDDESEGDGVGGIAAQREAGCLERLDPGCAQRAIEAARDRANAGHLKSRIVRREAAHEERERERDQQQPAYPRQNEP